MNNELNDIDHWNYFLKNLYQSQSQKNLPHPILDNLFQTYSLRQKKFFSVKNENNILTGISSTTIEKKIFRAITFFGFDQAKISKSHSITLIELNNDFLKNFNVKKWHVQTEEHDHQTQNTLIEMGFKKIRKYSSLLHISNKYQIPKIPNNIQVDSLQIGNEKKFANILNKSFKNEWGFCPNTVKEVIHSLYSPNDNLKDVIVLKQNNKLISFNWTKILKANIGKISMLGVHPQYQNLGIGKMTTLAGIDHLKKNNVKAITLEVDQRNIHAMKLYTNLGFEKYLSTIWFEKSL